jgi:hypothetical protein
LVKHDCTNKQEQIQALQARVQRLEVAKDELEIANDQLLLFALEARQLFPELKMPAAVRTQ